MVRFTLTGFIAAVMASVSSPSALAAPAEDGVPRSVRIGAYLGGQYFKWEEFSGTSSLLEETGLQGIAGVSLDNYERRTGGFIFGLDARAYAGEVDYDGQTLGGTPAVTDTQYEGYRGELLVGYRAVGAMDNYHVDVFGGAGYDRWDREILSTSSVSGSLEEYEIIYAKAGLGFVEKRYSNWFSRLQLGLKYPVDTNEDVPTFNAEGLEPGAKPAFFAALDLRQVEGPVGVTFFYDSYLFDKSGTVSSSIGNVFQPESDMDLFGVSLGLYF